MAQRWHNARIGFDGLEQTTCRCVRLPCNAVPCLAGPICLVRYGRADQVVRLPCTPLMAPTRHGHTRAPTHARTQTHRRLPPRYNPHTRSHAHKPERTTSVCCVCWPLAICGTAARPRAIFCRLRRLGDCLSACVPHRLHWLVVGTQQSLPYVQDGGGALHAAQARLIVRLMQPVSLRI